MITPHIENTISRDKNILFVLQENIEADSELHYLTENFCGKVIKDISEIKIPLNDKRIYVCGDISHLKNDANTFYVIRELSTNYENSNAKNIHLTELGKVPIVVSNAGIYFRDLFDNENYFDAIQSEHIFQHLTESNKDSKALRTGIYLTEVSKEKTEIGEEVLHYRLLRCSSNFTGPTDNFRDTDHVIINTLNEAITYTFENETKLYH
jgi:hypothetical protein